MFKAIGQFFKAVLSLFVAMEKFANAIVSVASVAEDTADAFHKEEALKNKAKLEKLQRKQQRKSTSSKSDKKRALEALETLANKQSEDSDSI